MPLWVIPFRMLRENESQYHYELPKIIHKVSGGAGTQTLDFCLQRLLHPILFAIPYMCNLTRNDTNELTKQKQTHRLREWAYGCQGKGEGDSIVREFGTGMYTLLYLKWITNKNLLYSTGNSVQCYVTAWFGGEWIHVYVRLSPFTVHLKLLQHC